jgi:hypothetical protein
VTIPPARPSAPDAGASLPAREILRRAFALLDAMEETQRDKVISLARRLLPTLTAEDIRNPHDFPDLDDPDWHFEDGQLAGIQAVRFALRGLSRDVLGDDEEGEGREERGSDSTLGSQEAREDDEQNRG